MADSNRFWFGAAIGTAVATIVMTATVLLTTRLERVDRANAIAACHARGGEVMLAEDGAWRCVCWPTKDGR
jgi:hypothetical protein